MIYSYRADEFGFRFLRPPNWSVCRKKNESALGVFMRIVIRPTVDENGRVAVDLWKALEVLRADNIQTEGAGTFGQDMDAYGVVILMHGADVTRAVAALKKAGIPVAKS